MTVWRTPKEKLLVALRRGEAERVVAMIDQFPAELEPNMSADTAENKLLHRAARYGHVKLIKCLVARGAEVEMENKFGMLPLHHGAVHGGEEVVGALLEAGADPNRADRAGRLPLHWAATKGHVGAARRLLEAGARVVGGDREGFTPLHRCCQEEPGPAQQEEEDRAGLDRNKAEVARLIIARGGDVSARESQGQQTPLHLAGMNGLSEVSSVLLEAGADPSAVNKVLHPSSSPLSHFSLDRTDSPHIRRAGAPREGGGDPDQGRGGRQLQQQAAQ